jgi:hypothetical protein
MKEIRRRSGGGGWLASVPAIGVALLPRFT